MKNPAPIFHLAIPCRDLDETEAFYARLPTCRKARRYDDRVTFVFFGHQVVCHLSPDEVDKEPRMYPRHFGITFASRADYDALLHTACEEALPMFKEPFVRFEGRREEHRTFFLVDPSNNLLEFKFYHDPDMRY